MDLSYGELVALEYAAWSGGGWPRAADTDEDAVIHDYRRLESLGLAQQIESDSKIVRGELRLHFVATDEGMAVFQALAAQS